MGRADAGVGRHRGHVGGQSDENTRAPRARAGRRDIDHGRHFRGVKRLDDLFGGFEQAAGGVELNDEALVVLRRSFVNGAGDIALGGRADGAIDFNQPHLRSLCHRCAQKQSRHGDEMPTLHKSPNLTGS